MQLQSFLLRMQSNFWININFGSFNKHSWSLFDWLLWVPSISEHVSGSCNMPVVFCSLQTHLRILPSVFTHDLSLKLLKLGENVRDWLAVHSCPTLIVRKQLLFTVTNNAREVHLCQLLSTWPCWTPAQSHFGSVQMAEVSFLSSATFPHKWRLVPGEGCIIQAALCHVSSFSSNINSAG